MSSDDEKTRGELHHTVAVLITRARRDEREACAAIAEAEAIRPKKIPHSHPEAQAYAAACERIARDIRARGGT